MKSILHLLAVGCLLCLTAGCGYWTSGPSQTVKRFWAHLERGEIEEVEELISKDSPGNRESQKQALAYLPLLLKERGGVESLEVEKEDIVGEVADVSFVVTCKDKSAFRYRNILVREGGEWKLRDTIKQ